MGKNSYFFTSFTCPDITGGFSTIVASFLARMRGNSEPELSNNRAQTLQQFIRRCEEYVADHGRETGDETNKEVQQYRDWLDEILKNPNEWVMYFFYVARPV